MFCICVLKTKQGSVVYHLYFSFLLYQNHFQLFCVCGLAGERSGRIFSVFVFWRGSVVGVKLCVFGFILLHHEHLYFSLCLCLCSNDEAGECSGCEVVCLWIYSFASQALVFSLCSCSGGGV